jgi:hypothetical protein
VGGGVQTGSTRHRGHLLSYYACSGWLWGWRIIRWNEDWQGKPKYSEKTYPSATLSTTNSTWPDPGSNPGWRGGNPATNSLSYGAADLLQLVTHSHFIKLIFKQYSAIVDLHNLPTTVAHGLGFLWLHESSHSNGFQHTTITVSHIKCFLHRSTIHVSSSGTLLVWNWTELLLY